VTNHHLTILDISFYLNFRCVPELERIQMSNEIYAEKVWSVLLVEETAVHGETHLSAVSH
jgi:hypothetical protein